MITVTLTERQFKVVQMALISMLRDVDKSLDSQWLSQDPLDLELKERILELCKGPFHADKLPK